MVGYVEHVALHLPVAGVSARCAAPSAVVVARGAQQRSSMEQRMLLLLLLMMPGVMRALSIAARDNKVAISRRDE